MKVIDKRTKPSVCEGTVQGLIKKWSSMPKPLDAILIDDYGLVPNPAELFQRLKAAGFGEEKVPG